MLEEVIHVAGTSAELHAKLTAASATEHDKMDGDCLPPPPINWSHVMGFLPLVTCALSKWTSEIIGIKEKDVLATIKVIFVNMPALTCCQRSLFINKEVFLSTKKSLYKQICFLLNLIELYCLPHLQDSYVFLLSSTFNLLASFYSKLSSQVCKELYQFGISTFTFYSAVR